MTKINSSPLPDTPANLGRELATAIIGFHENLARKVGMTAAESRCLGELTRRGTATPSELAAATGLTTGAITGIVDRLERQGLAKRAPNPNDRRSVIVQALSRPDLQGILRAHYDALGKEMTSLGAEFSPEETAAIATWLVRTIAILRSETEKMKASK